MQGNRAGNNLSHKESGVVVLGLFALLILVLCAVAFFFVKRAQDNKSVSTTAAEAVEAGGSVINRSAVNLQRKNDAELLLSSVNKYAKAHDGALPKTVTSSMLAGTGHYGHARVLTGEQPAVTDDELLLVTGAQCALSGAAVEGSSHQFAVQYAIQNGDNSFTPQCLAK